MSARDLLRIVAASIEGELDGKMQGPGRGAVAALRALADRIDREFELFAVGSDQWNSFALSLLSRLDADLAPPQKEPR